MSIRIGFPLLMAACWGRLLVSSWGTPLLLPPDDRAAREVWHPMTGSTPVSVVVKDGQPALAMRCNFQNTRMERASWDGDMALNLAGCRGFQFRFRCPDSSPVAQFSLYFRSGDGWYTTSFGSGAPDAWNTITFDKTEMRIEGTPAGWATIDRIRISAWRGTDVDTSFFIRELEPLGADAPIAVIATGTGPGTAGGLNEYARNLVGLLDEMGVSFSVIADLDLNDDTLATRKLVVLPYNPTLPEPAMVSLRGFLDDGGKLISFYHLPPTLEPLLHIAGGRHVRESRDGAFAAIHGTNDVLRGLPAVTRQRSWNIQSAHPTAPESRVAATWYDDRGQSTGEPAIVISDNCIFMTHVLLNDDRARQRRMLLAMVGHFLPDAWRNATDQGLARITRFGPYQGVTDAESRLRRAAEGNRSAGDLLEKAIRLRVRAEDWAKAGDPIEALGLAGEAREAFLETYLTVQTPQEDEHRAFWCHSAFGVAGMEWDEAIRRLAEHGFTAILPNMLWGGVTFGRSDVLPVAPGVEERGDQIAACLAACKKYGVACHVWKVNWNMGWPTGKEFVDQMRQEGRTQVRRDGEIQERWLCPSHPANQQLEIDAMLEVVTRYDVDGIHFDYIRYPGSDHCFCDGCRQRFEQATGTPIADWPAAVATGRPMHQPWLAFRRRQITAVVAAVSERARGIRPGIRISAAVFPNAPVDRDSIGQDWQQWCEQGYLDFVCPMNYTSDDTDFERAVQRQQSWIGSVPCYPGIGLSTWSGRDTICSLIEKIRITRRLRTGGFTVFNYGPTEAAEILPGCAKGITRRP